ncbi:SCO3242 family prenyltransferase [Halosaccharopolyspora lacisalsi]|nr:UbiA family prenyltransferase [Halosaccharopolyspora lacisalsi]
MDPKAVIHLVRAPAALSVPGDVLAGAASARSLGKATPALVAASCCLYWAGMALNDYADREVDARERPHRPIPAGRVDARFALALAGGLTTVGLGITTLAQGRRGLAVAAPLAATVWGYDLVLKNTPAAPATMAAARALDVLLGAGLGRLRQAAPAAVVMGAHTFTVTTLSRREVAGSGRALPAGALAATAGVTGVVAGASNSRRDNGVPSGLAPLAAYAAGVGHAQLAAVRDPGPHRLQRAVGAGILGMIPLQSALLAGRGARRTAACLMAALPLARRLSRKVSPT